ncbi:PEP-CTERM sorting domain-containing protein [Zoogloea sp.]|uniref:PEP-CTERM sorting domain-containing protein n=1 Tax=Zoogloea sp. TaxID=49181 RepID=UPI0035B0495D
MRTHAPSRCLPRFLRGAALAAAIGISVPAVAALSTYQNQATFSTAITGLTATTTNFDSLAPGTSYAPGSGPAGSGFTVGLTAGSVSSGFNLPTVGNTFWTTSGTNYLGLDNPDSAFESGDELVFSFLSPVRGFGLYVVGGHDLLDLQAGAVTLTVNGSTVAISSTDYLASGNGDYAFFLGFATDDGSTFNSATLTVGDGSGVIPVTVDDVTLARTRKGGNAVPEPGTLLLVSTAIGAAWQRARSRRR